MLISSELLILNLMGYIDQNNLKLKIITDYFAFLKKEIEKRYLTYFEIDSDLDNLGYTAKYLIKEADAWKIDKNINLVDVKNYLKVNVLDDEIEAIINSFVTKYSFDECKLMLNESTYQLNNELVLKHRRQCDCQVI